MPPSLAIVVLNWNGAEDTLACLASLRASTVPAYVIVVDNGSTDDSVHRITAAHPDEIVRMTENCGYAVGNNAGLRLALDSGFDVIAVLNNDTIVAPDTFSLLLDELPPSQHRAVGPDIRYADRPEESWFAGGVIDKGGPRPLQPEELADDQRSPRPTPWLSGCCIVARRETWEHVGLFDPRYFLSFEDCDWSLRAVQNGVSLYVVTSGVIRHRVSSSTRQSSTAWLLSNYYFVCNGLRFETRYFARHVPRFGFQWLVRPGPELIRNRKCRPLAFRWLGAVGFVLARRGRAPRILERLAARSGRDSQ
jgi:hypothetical protein